MTDVADDEETRIATPQEIERGLVRLFGELLPGGEGAGPSADFFDLGGDSLLATTLVAAIEREFDIVLPPSALLEAPTPSKLVHSIIAARDYVEATSLVPIRPEGQGPPLFCIHGMPGDTIYIRKLARAMGGSRPVYGLRATGLRNGEAMLPTVEEMAEAYLAEIRAACPSGPYLLAGQCRTAVIALQLASRMVSEGQAVPGLVLIDPGVGEGQASWMADDSRAAAAVHRANGANRAQAAHEQMKSNPTMSGKHRRILFKWGIKGVISAYSLRTYAGPTLLIVSESRRDRILDPDHGLPRILPDLEICEIGTTHSTVFHQHIGTLAAAINTFFDRVAPM